MLATPAPLRFFFVCYLSATCLLPAACCLLPACCLPCVAFFHRCIFSASCGNTFPTFLFYTRACPECSLLT
jgi:hypothetical protein